MIKLKYTIEPDIVQKLTLKDPNSSELGQLIINKSIDLMIEIGFEKFSFKKLAENINSTEASIYRYFENKQKLLHFLITSYWSILDYEINLKMKYENNSESKIDRILKILLNIDDYEFEIENKSQLFELSLSQSSKTYFINDVNKLNTEHLYKPYKDLVATIAVIFLDYNKEYPYPNSLASMVVETSHSQLFFEKNLPRLTNTKSYYEGNYVYKFLKDIVFKSLKNT